MTTPTPAAIEAIAVAMFYQQVGLKPPYPLWDDADAVEKDNCRNDAQLAYDAMAPFIAAQAKAEALREAAAAVEVIDPAWDSALYVDGAYHPLPDWLRARATTIETDVTP